VARAAKAVFVHPKPSALAARNLLFTAVVESPRLRTLSLGLDAPAEPVQLALAPVIDPPLRTRS